MFDLRQLWRGRLCELPQSGTDARGTFHIVLHVWHCFTGCVSDCPASTDDLMLSAFTITIMTSITIYWSHYHFDMGCTSKELKSTCPRLDLLWYKNQWWSKEKLTRQRCGSNKSYCVAAKSSIGRIIVLIKYAKPVVRLGIAVQILYKHIFAHEQSFLEHKRILVHWRVSAIVALKSCPRDNTGLARQEDGSALAECWDCWARYYLRVAVLSCVMPNPLWGLLMYRHKWLTQDSQCRILVETK